MSFIRRILVTLRLRRAARAAGYGAEVLFAGWVELPKGFREIIARR